MATKKTANPETDVEAVEKTAVEAESFDIHKYLNEKVEVELFKDNERYKDDFFIGINGKTWQIQRGVRVSVPRYVALAIDDTLKQRKEADRIKTYYSSRDREIPQG